MSDSGVFIMGLEDGDPARDTIERIFEPAKELRRCACCGAVEGLPHHDRGFGYLIVKMRRSRLRKRLECQLCNAGAAALRREERRNPKLYKRH